MIRTLQSLEELRSCRQRLRERRLDFTHPSRVRFWRFLYQLRYRRELPVADIMKSWDVSNAMGLIENAVADRGSPILDMGCFNSEILYVLHGLGYRRLHGCDVNPMCRWMPFWHSIRYRMADLTRTAYPDRHFAAITCLSVIEHGVPLEGLVTEIFRLLRAGGLFVLTTDYDATGRRHVISKDFQVFGLGWRIFTPNDLSRLIEQFRKVGFLLMDPESINATHSECPVTWNGQDYTFVMVALKAPDE